MKIIISIDPIRFPLTGIGRYTYELVRHLQSSNQIDNLIFFTGRKAISTLPNYDVAGVVVPKSTFPLKRWVQSSRLASEAYRQLLPLIQGFNLRGYENYLYHGPNFYLPSSLGPKVATFHDLSPFTWTHCHPAERVRFMQKELSKTLRTADALITDSEYTRNELANYFSWPLDRVHAVPLASSPEFYPRSEAEVRPTLDRYGLRPNAYSLYVGTIEPRKNLIALLDSYSRLPLHTRQKWPLVLAGHPGWNSEDIHARINQAKQEGWAHYLGFTPAEDLPMLFAGARLFVFPSLYEGFGLPVLEAMSSGIPVVCSNTSSLPEVAGNTALMTSPDDIEGFTDLFGRGLEDASWREQAVAEGLLQASTFSWAKCAESTIDVYRSVLESR
ncbi:glycosyltransferase family 4 protein [Marinospirillum perlucidum]|uniref:glycosyltransferase family 4 protein n=1 Tax=Marinospirillum perlucidum TaxID=1982602 RepID=UPI000DF424E5|nr:glycosyltransferase family 1 protein [Marinospirillum perlucidum]